MTCIIKELTQVVTCEITETDPLCLDPGETLWLQIEGHRFSITYDAAITIVAQSGKDESGRTGVIYHALRTDDVLRGV